jgi:hypothetical protein
MAKKRELSGIVPESVIAVTYVPNWLKVLGFQNIGAPTQQRSRIFSTAMAN